MIDIKLRDNKLRVKIDGPLSDVDSLNRLVGACGALNDDSKVELIINSGGGNLDQPLLAAEILSRLPNTTSIATRAESAAFVLWASCANRYAYPNSKLMSHAPHIDLGPSDRDELSAAVKRIDGSVRRYSAVLQRRLGLTEADADALLRKHNAFDGYAAKDLGWLTTLLSAPRPASKADQARAAEIVLESRLRTQQIAADGYQRRQQQRQSDLMSRVYSAINRPSIINPAERHLAECAEWMAHNPGRDLPWRLAG